MADTTAPAMGVLDDVLSLARALRPGWEDQLNRLRASGVPLLAGDGDGGSGDSGDGGQGGSGDSSAAAAAAAAAGDDGDGDANLSEAGKKALNAERKARRDAEKQAREAQARIQEFEQRDLTEQQKLEKRAAEAEGKVPTLEAENTRLRVALEKGLVGDRAFLADRLRGTTKEELTADADELLKQFGGGGTGRTTFDGGARGSAAPTDMDTLIRQKAGYA